MLLAQSKPSICRPSLNAPSAHGAPMAHVRAFAVMQNNRPNGDDNVLHQGRSSNGRRCKPVAAQPLRGLSEDSENGAVTLSNCTSSPPTSPLSPIVQNVNRNNSSLNFTMSPKKHRRLTPIVLSSALKENRETQRLCSMQRVPKLGSGEKSPKNLYMVAALLSRHMSLEELDIQIEAEKETIELLHRVKARKRALQQSHSSLSRLVQHPHDTNSETQLPGVSRRQRTPPSSLSRSLFHVVASNLDMIEEGSSSEPASPTTPVHTPSLPSISHINNSLAKYFGSNGVEMPTLPPCDYPLDTSDEEDALAEDESDDDSIADTTRPSFNSDFVRVIQLPCLEGPAESPAHATETVVAAEKTHGQRTEGPATRRQWATNTPCEILDVMSTTTWRCSDLTGSDADDACYNEGYCDNITPLYVEAGEDMPGIIEATPPRTNSATPPNSGRQSKRVKSLSSR